MKQPKLAHVKWQKSKGHLYPYFNTGQKKASGATIYLRLPDPASAEFYAEYARMKRAREKRATVAYTVADMARDYQHSTQFQAELAVNSQKIYALTLRKMVKLLGEFTVDDLERSDVQLVLDNEMAGAGSHNLFLGVVGALYKWGRARGKTSAEPTKEIKTLKMGEHQPWPDHVLEAGLYAEDDLTRLLVKLLFYTGQRVGDVLKMRRSDIKNGVIEVWQQKTDKTVWIPLLNELAEELETAPRKGLTIVAGDDGKPLTVRKVSDYLQAFCDKLGHKTVTHGLRKNAVNAFLEAGSSVAEVSAITGQTYAMVEHYAKKINQQRMAESAVIKLEAKRAKKEKTA